MKIGQKLKQYEEAGSTYFSFEFFPPKTPAGVANLYDRVERLSKLEPAFIDITWGAGGSTAEVTLDLATNFQTNLCLETQMHLTCTNMEVAKIDSALEKARSCGIQNILALRGDPPAGQERWQAVDGGFSHAVDLVSRQPFPKNFHTFGSLLIWLLSSRESLGHFLAQVRYIKQKHGDYFGIAVAGYPEGHIDAVSYEEDLKHLKDKVQAGADVIVTQLFYDADNFIKWCADVRAAGITVPILPGIMPINNYGSWKRMTDMCKTQIPPEIRAGLEAIKDDDEACKKFGVKVVSELCKKILASGYVHGLHMYTLNLEQSVVAILNHCGLTGDCHLRRELPWRARLNGKEDVRPIFWANRPKSYMVRTNSWDEFPNGRWGDSRSPAFGELTTYHLETPLDTDKALKDWGNPETHEHIRAVFCSFVEGKILQLPWCESLSHETGIISHELLLLNKAGFLSINSQPSVNGKPSDDAVFGWGGSGGFVYQKAYIEFFCLPEQFEQLIEVLRDFKSITYNAVNRAGDKRSNYEGSTHVNAVTWGVFPGREIVQPTVVDSESFYIWKDEAFSLWESRWQRLYDSRSRQFQLIQECMDTMMLVNLVDNDFMSGNIFSPFHRLGI